MGKGIAFIYRNASGLIGKIRNMITNEKCMGLKMPVEGELINIGESFFMSTRLNSVL